MVRLPTNFNDKIGSRPVLSQATAEPPVKVTPFGFQRRRRGRRRKIVRSAARGEFGNYAVGALATDRLRW